MAQSSQLFVEAYRLHLLRGLEQFLAQGGYSLVAGVDEVGRGCLAGPVVAAAVLVDPRSWVPGVDDSKRLSAEKRQAVEKVIRSRARAWAVASVSAPEIDEVNILEASRQAMARALLSLQVVPDCALVDAVTLDGLPYPCLALVGGDAMCYAIASASIVAKVHRDRLMVEYDRKYPQYGFARNKGYGAREHRQALAEFGPTPIHRLTFRSVLPRRATGSEVRAE